MLTSHTPSSLSYIATPSVIFSTGGPRVPASSPQTPQRLEALRRAVPQGGESDCRRRIAGYRAILKGLSRLSRLLRLLQLQYRELLLYPAPPLLPSLTAALVSLVSSRTTSPIALVLPGSFLHAKYASVVRDAVQKSFGRVTVVAVDEQLFPDAKEESILLLAERKGKEPCELRIGGVSKRFLRLTEENLSRYTRKLFKTEQDQSWMRGMLNQAALSIYDGVLPLLPKLGEIATIRIGAVTGSNRYFTLRPSELREAGVPSRYARPIITRATQLASCVLTKTDMQTLLKADAKALLFSPPLNGRLHPKVLEYIKLGESLGVPTKSKCAGRRPWYRVPNSSPPDAFLLYMTENAPRVILNSAGASCTNAIHALSWRESKSVRPESVAFAFLTTLTQLASELEGRSYGDGVLKLEPSEAARLPLPVIKRLV